MRQGTTWASYVLGKQIVEQHQLGGVPTIVYAVDIETNNSYSGITKTTNWVQCSTEEPFVAFEADDILA